MGNKKRLVTSIGITMLAFVVNYLITLVLTPYITDNIGTDAYGYVTLAKNIAQYASYVTLALNSMAVRFIAVEYHRKNMDRANTYFSSTFYGDLVLASIVLAGSFVFIILIDKILNVPRELLFDIRILFLFVFVKFWILALLNVYESGFFIANRMDISGVFKLLSYVAEAVVLIALFKVFSPNLYFVGIGVLASALVTTVSNIWITKKFTTGLKVRKRFFEKQAIKDLVGNGIWSSFNSLGSFLHSGLDLIITNIMLTPVMMGQLAIVESVNMIFKSIPQIISYPFQPILLKNYADNNRKQLIKTFLLSIKTTCWLTNVGYAGFVALGMAYYRLWIPNQDIGFLYRLTVFAAATAVSTGIAMPLYYVYNLTLKKVVTCITTLITGGLNLVGMLILLTYTGLGLYAVTGTTVVLMCVTNLIIHPYFAAKLLKERKTLFYPTILRCLLSCAVLCAVYKLFSILYMPENWFGFAIAVVIYVIIGTMIHFMIVFRKEERISTIRLIKEKVRG